MFKRRNVIFLLAAIALLGGLATGRGLFYTAAYILGLLLIFAFLWSWSNITYVQLRRKTGGRRVQVGEVLEELFSMQNTSSVPKLWVEMRDESNLPNHFASQVVSNLGSKKDKKWRLVTLATDRGRYRLGPVTLRTSDPFGLFPMEKVWSATSNVVIHPFTFPIPTFPLPTGLLPGGDALRRRTQQITTNAVGVRDYAPGDAFSRIHWRSSARRNRLIVKEFELDPMADIWVIADMDKGVHIGSHNSHYDDFTAQTMADHSRLNFALPASTEEYTVSIAASLSQHFLRQDRAVGLIAHGQSREILQPDRGERQRNRIMETMAVIRAEGSVSITDVASNEGATIPRGSTVLIVTPAYDPEWAMIAKQLLRRGLRIVTILLNPQSFGGGYSNQALHTSLLSLGIATYVINYGDDIALKMSQGYKAK